MHVPIVPSPSWEKSDESLREIIILWHLIANYSLSFLTILSRTVEILVDVTITPYSMIKIVVKDVTEKD